MNMKVYVKILRHMLMKTKMNLFSNYQHKLNLNFFSHDKVKF